MHVWAPEVGGSSGTQRMRVVRLGGGWGGSGDTAGWGGSGSIASVLHPFQVGRGGAARVHYVPLLLPSP